MESDRFGAYLQRLLDQSDGTCNALCLARHLDYSDASTIYRWMRGEQTPALDTEHVSHIIEHLRLSHVEARNLHNAQLMSLQNRKQGKRRTPKITPVGPVKEQMGHEAEAQRIQRDPTPSSPDHPYAQIVDVLAQMIDLLEQLPDAGARSTSDRTIILTWQSRDSVELPSELQARWLPALETALRRGWRVLYLCRLDGNAYRTVGLVKAMQSLYCAGSYLPRYFTSYGTLAPPYDMLVIPGIAAAMMFATTNMHTVDAGVITCHENRVKLLLAHALQLARQTTPLVRSYFLPHAELMASQTLTRAESHPGGRYLVKDGLSVITQPESWFSERPLSRIPSSLPSENLRAAMEHHRKRIVAFHHHVATHDYSDICTVRAIDALVYDGAYIDDSAPGVPHSLDTRLEHLRNVVRLLRHCPRYHLALIGEGSAQAADVSSVADGAMWEVTGGDSVFMSTRMPDKAGRLVNANLHIAEPTVAEAFRVSFRQLWERIPPEFRERDQVIRYLEQRIAELKQRDSSDAGD